MMKCKNCGTEILDNYKFCKNCGTKVNPPIENTVLQQAVVSENKNLNNNEVENVISTEKNIQSKKDDGNIYIIIWIVGILATKLLPYICLSFEFLYPLYRYINLCPLISLAAIVTGKIKCPDNRAIKVLFWLTILYTILIFILAMWMWYTCVTNCNNSSLY